MTALRTALAGENADIIRQRTEALSQAAMRLAQAAQGSAQAGAGATAPPGGPGRGGDDVVDAEFEDVDDSKRHAS